MKTKVILLSVGILLWVSEPFLVLARPLHNAKSSICATCHMKNKCGAVCCCSNVKSVDPDCYRHFPGLYAPGCSPDQSAAHFLGQNTAKWFAPSQPWIAPIPAQRRFASVFVSVPSPTIDLLNPPPEFGFPS